MADPTNWRDRALCGGLDPTVFFPEPPGGTELAARICAACPVQPECLAEALKLRDTYGYRGGRTGEGRARLLRNTLPRITRPVPAEDVAALLALGWTCKAIAGRLDAHVDSVRRVRRRLLKGQEVAA